MTQGDANPVSDPSAIPASWVSGRVALFAPVLGYVLVFLSLPTGWISLLSFLVSVWLAGRLLVATAGLQGAGTVRTTVATFADSSAVGSNSFTTGTWGP